MVNLMAYNFLDGLNMDFESGIKPRQGAQRTGLTLLMKELNSTVKARWPHAQLSFDFPYAPSCTFGRCYDYKALTKELDFGVIMAYDLPKKSKKYAFSRNAYGTTEYGIKRFLSQGIPASKLVLGVPWYGYSFGCRNYNMGTAMCLVGTSFQVQYSKIVENYLPISFTGRRWSPDARAPFATVKDLFTGTIYQVWYDDHESLGLKYELARTLKLRGVAMWTADAIDYDDPAQVMDIWGPI